MAHYALLNNANIVQKVIVGVDENDTSNLPSEFSSWEDFYANKKNYPKCKRTSYNTIANTHLLDGTPFRGNYAGIGYKYDEDNDVFIAPQPYDSWSLDSNWVWQSPISFPTDTNPEKDTSLPLKSYTWVDEVYVQDNTKGWVLTATYNYNSETEEWDKV
tara:strand:- start:1553 stop:2029 length:477 start_codon:yes stop_codon:yes gene_type:complete